MKWFCHILEGSWWKPQELPQVLPYFQALTATRPEIGLTHRTIRSLDDIRFWVKKVPKNSRSFLYFACHGQDLDLLPDRNKRNRVHRGDLLEVLGEAKPNAIAFLHFGCCEMVDPQRRGASLRELARAANAHWVSGYIEEVDWFRSMFLDLALLAEVYLPFAMAGSGPGPKLKHHVTRFMGDYSQLAKRLGFSGLARGIVGQNNLFPKRLMRARS